MDVQDLVLQGGSLAVVLTAFSFILNFLLNSFSKSMGAIERALHLNTLTLLGLSQQIMHHDMTMSNLENMDDRERADTALKKYDSVSVQIQTLSKTLEGMIEKRI